MDDFSQLSLAVEVNHDVSWLKSSWVANRSAVERADVYAPMSCCTGGMSLETRAAFTLSPDEIIMLEATYVLPAVMSFE